MATAKKTAASKPASKAASKKAAATTPEVAMPEVGGYVEFTGYGKGVKAADKVLTKGEKYEIAEVGEGAPGDPDFGIAVYFANPDFDESKDASDENPEYVEVEIVEGEFTLTDAPAEEGDAATEPAAETPVATKKAAAKGAAASKKAPAAKKAPKEKVEPETDTPELENENPDVLALVEEAGDDLLTTATDLEGQVGVTEFQLGGIVYHLKKSKQYLEYNVDKKGVSEFAGPGGWQLFCDTYLNAGYRKAQALLMIYVAFTKYGIEDASGVISQMGWAKANKIVPFFGQKGAKVATLIKEATENTVIGLSEIITDKYRQPKETDNNEPPTVRKTLRFRYLEEQGKLVEDTLTVAMDQLKLKDVGEALLAIVTEWGQQHAATKPAGTTSRAKPVASTSAKPSARKVAATA